MTATSCAARSVAVGAAVMAAPLPSLAAARAARRVGWASGCGELQLHIYRTPGTYCIAVLASYPLYGAWQPFDYVTIHVD